MLKFQPQEMIAFAVSDMDNLGSDILCALRDGRRSGQWSTRDFQRNLRCWPKSAMHGDKCPASGHVQSGREFQEVFAALITTADENWNGERQPYPLAALYAGFKLIQTVAPQAGTENVLAAPIGPNEL